MLREAVRNLWMSNVVEQTRRSAWETDELRREESFVLAITLSTNPFHPSDRLWEPRDWLKWNSSRELNLLPTARRMNVNLNHQRWVYTTPWAGDPSSGRGPRLEGRGEGCWDRLRHTCSNKQRGQNIIRRRSFQRGAMMKFDQLSPSIHFSSTWDLVNSHCLCHLRSGRDVRKKDLALMTLMREWFDKRTHPIARVYYFGLFIWKKKKKRAWLIVSLCASICLRFDSIHFSSKECFLHTLLKSNIHFTLEAFHKDLSDHDRL